MKKVISCIGMLLFVIAALGQQIPPDVQKKIDEARAKLKAMQSDPQLQAKMQRAQHILDSVKGSSQFQKQMQTANHRLDSAKTTNSSLGNVQIPDVNNMSIPGSIQAPNMDSIENALKNSTAQLQTYTQAMNQSTPKLNLSSHAESLPKLTGSVLTGIASAELKVAKSHLDMISLSNLDKMAKDNKINLAGTGVFLLSTGGSADAALFLICQAIIKNPQDPWAANDLGIYFRDQMNYKESLQCYFYANTLDTGKSAVINTNIGWAAAYYGDFETGEKYFDKALAINGDFSSANEGEAMIAYAKGDLGALLKCLAKEIKYLGGGGGGGMDNGPSDAFSNSCGGAISQNNMQDSGKPASDPGNDHTFDNSNDNGQDSPPGADVDDITYPGYKKVFINDPKDLITVAAAFLKQTQNAYNDLKQRSANLTQQLKSLKPLGQPPYRDDEGNLVISNNFQKFVALLPPIQESLENRIAWYDAQLAKKLEPFRKDVLNRDVDLVNGYVNALKGCGDDKRCTQEVMCTWLPKMYKSKNDDLDAAGQMWDDYYDKVSKAIQWYIDASAPFISRVHQEGWNQYLNANREFYVRKAIVHAYGWWQAAITDIMTPLIGYVAQVPPDCPPVQIAGSAPDPFSKKPKHIKEFEGPCYDMTFGFGVGVEETCHSSKFFVGAGPLKAFYQHINDPIAAQNSNYTNKMGVDVSVSKDIEIVKAGDKSLLSASAGVEGKVEAQFDDNWQFTGGSSSIGASADIGGLNLGGIEATRTVEVVDGQVNVSPLQVSTSGPLH